MRKKVKFFKDLNQPAKIDKIDEDDQSSDDGVSKIKKSGSKIQASSNFLNNSKRNKHKVIKNGLFNYVIEEN